MLLVIKGVHHRVVFLQEMQEGSRPTTVYGRKRKVQLGWSTGSLKGRGCQCCFGGGAGQQEEGGTRQGYKTGSKRRHLGVRFGSPSG